MNGLHSIMGNNRGPDRGRRFVAANKNEPSWTSRISVAVGRSVNLEPEDLVNVPLDKDTLGCHGRVVQQPNSQRVGSVYPKNFPCYFTSGVVIYSHYGSPILNEDVVQFSIYIFKKNITIHRSAYVFINIKHVAYDVVAIHYPVSSLTVKQFYGMSTSLPAIFVFSKRVTQNTTCMVKYDSNTMSWPRKGFLIGDFPDRKLTRQNRQFYVECSEFLRMRALRYKHRFPPGPNIDFVPFRIELADISTEPQLTVEYIQIPIRITGAIANEAPKVSLMSTQLIEINQLTVSTVTSNSLAVTDRESGPSDLVYSVVHAMNENQGRFVYVDRPTMSITAFRQSEVNANQVGYWPPSPGSISDHIITIGLEAFDDYYAASQRIDLHIAVIPVGITEKFISCKRSLMAMHGQDIVIDQRYFYMTGEAANSTLWFYIRTLPLSGSILVNGNDASFSSRTFNSDDLKSNLVVFRHSDLQTRRDYIELRVTNSKLIANIILPIEIVFNNQRPPWLESKRALRVKEGETARLTSKLLKVADDESPPNTLKIQMQTQPKGGNIIKKLHPIAQEVPVKSFTQKELHLGMIYYRHNKPMVLSDNFKFQVTDGKHINDTVFVFRIIVKPLKEFSPHLDKGVSLSMTTKQAGIVPLRKRHIQYKDPDSKNGKLLFTITRQPYFVDANETVDSHNGGLVVSLPTSKHYDPSALSPLSLFTQYDLNHNKIGYMPPIKDIGPHARDVCFNFNVADPSGNAVIDQVFRIRLLPVDDKPPSLDFKSVHVKENRQVVIMPYHMVVTDVDTEINNLKFHITSNPSHGNLSLSGRPLLQNSQFVYRDFLNGRVMYTHDGSDSIVDSFKISVSDGKQKVVETVKIVVTPIDDELPYLLKSISLSVKVKERGSVLITTNVISATDADTSDPEIIFTIVDAPKLGIVLLSGKPVTSFLQRDIVKKALSYKHTGPEIGFYPRTDIFSIVVSDRASPILNDTQTTNVSVIIEPVDNQAPQIQIGGPIVVNESGHTILTNKMFTVYDEDTRPVKLTFYISRAPRWGKIVSPLSEQTALSSFSLHDLNQLRIAYIQSKHKGVEPVSDSFEVYVSDQFKTSPKVSIPIDIVSVNDEYPELSAQKLVIDEGGNIDLTDILLSVRDLDKPSQSLSVYIKSQPQHGRILLSQSSSPSLQLITSYKVSLLNLRLNRYRLLYQHDGSDSVDDQIKLFITDGSLTTRVVIYAIIQPVNDKKPFVLKNDVIGVNFAEQTLISSSNFAVSDDDTSPTNITCQLLTLPKNGNLQLLSAYHDTFRWQSLLINESFTQSDIDHNRLRYEHTSQSTDDDSMWRDQVTVRVDDGLHVLPNVSISFSITLSPNKKVAIFKKTVVLVEGSRAAITPEHLKAVPLIYVKPQVVFRVTKRVEHGQMVRDESSGQVSSFTDIDIVSNQIFYKHTDFFSVPRDELDFDVYLDNVKVANDSLDFLIEQSNRLLPNLTTTEPIYVAKNSFVVLKPSNLLLNHDLVNASHLFFTVVKPPQYGQLAIQNTVVSNFTQADINNGLIAYFHNKESFINDSFVVSASVHARQGAYFNNMLTKFHLINIVVLTGASKTEDLKVVINKAPRYLTTFSARRVGFVLSEHNLKCRTSGDDYDPEKLQYEFLVLPKFGEFLVRKIRSGNFTQADINARKVTYRVKHIGAGQDHVVLLARYPGLRSLSLTINFSWPVISWHNKPIITVCENVRQVKLRVRRTGSTSTPAFVTVRPRSLSARNGWHFRAETQQLKFNPGEIELQWPVQIRNHKNRGNRKYRKFKVALWKPVYAVIAGRNSVTVRILSTNHALCGKHENQRDDPAAKQSRRRRKQRKRKKAATLALPSTPASTACSGVTKGLIHFDSETRSLFRCDGSFWLPWRSKENGRETKGLLITKCRQGWSSYQSRCYKMLAKRATWNSAEETCLSLGGHLASVTSVLQLNWLWRLAGASHFWIGLNSKDSFGEWRYTTNDVMIFTFWKQGYPKTRQHNPQRACVLVHSNALWVNRSCDRAKARIICVTSPKS